MTQSRPIEQGDILWTPTVAQRAQTRLYDYMNWLNNTQDLSFESYEELWKWSTEQIESFWKSITEYFEVDIEGATTPVLTTREMPGALWYPEARLNYAQHVFRNATDDRPAIIVRSEDQPLREVSWKELWDKTASLAQTLRSLGVSEGDRVVSYMPNRAETVIAFLACASLGAVWSACAPDMGITVVLDRFRQIEPKVMLAVDSYTYNGKVHDRYQLVDDVLRELPSVRHVIHVPGPSADETREEWRGRLTWEEATRSPAELTFRSLPFSHPLWIVYSSGTTGLPKALVHSHGGIVLTHLKTMALQHDLRPGDRLMFLGSAGWIVWNLQVGALLVGASIVLYDGNPAWPNSEAIWRFMDQQEVTLFGCGAAFLANCMKDQIRPKSFVTLARLRAITATGSPLSIDAYGWVYESIKSDLWLASICGGTDIASGLVACAPVLPVAAGEIQCRELGVAAYAFNEAGEAVIDEVGELVVTQPMPSMPVFFWNDPHGQRYHNSYFENYPGIWRHGDWVRFTPGGACVIYGRSDTTINRFGIRMGTAEIYRVVEELVEVRDSMVVDLEYLGKPSRLVLFVVPHTEHTLDESLKVKIGQQIRSKASPRHVPDIIVQVREIPRTLTGKKMELPVRKILLGARPEKVANPDAMANPESLKFFVDFAVAMTTEQT